MRPLIQRKKASKKIEFDLKLAIGDYLLWKYPAIHFWIRHDKLLPGYLIKDLGRLQSKNQLDVYVLYSVVHYGGLILETKKSLDEIVTKKGTMRTNAHLQAQLQQMAYLRKQGNCVKFVWSIEQGMEIIDLYFRGKNLDNDPRSPFFFHGATELSEYSTL